MVKGGVCPECGAHLVVWADEPQPAREFERRNFLSRLERKWNREYLRHAGYHVPAAGSANEADRD